jgi:hypothetical protein
MVPLLEVRPNVQLDRERGHGGEAVVFQQLPEGDFEVVHGCRSVVMAVAIRIAGS